MKKNWYLKSILTIIALCLIALVFKNDNIIKKAHATLADITYVFGEPGTGYPCLIVKNDSSAREYLMTVDDSDTLNVKWVITKTN